MRFCFQIFVCNYLMQDYLNVFIKKRMMKKLTVQIVEIGLSPPLVTAFANSKQKNNHAQA